MITIALYRTRLPPRKAGPLIEWTAFKEAPYALYCAAMFFNFWVSRKHIFTASEADVNSGTVLRLLLHRILWPKRARRELPAVDQSPSHSTSSSIYKLEAQLTSISGCMRRFHLPLSTELLRRPCGNVEHAHSFHLSLQYHDVRLDRRQLRAQPLRLRSTLWLRLRRSTVSIPGCLWHPDAGT